ncbi:glycosyl hydrolase 108 family protein [Paraburkholderia sp. A1RI-2L]|uniref:glycoside hydrolase family 108 protein n=1 Tax=Paraburkholderia sp. A1RI-2L TaxID=3028367 RepID=UPI003B7B4E75
MTDDDIIDYVLRFEGGFTNNPSDHGGPTNFGITAADYGRFLGLHGPASAEQISNMSRNDAIAIYKRDYIALPGFGPITDGTIKLTVVDAGVLFGTSRSTRWLQQALQIKADGIMGTDTLGALSACTDPPKLARAMLALRFGAIADIVAKDQSQIIFLRGWVSRATSLLNML